MTSSDDWKQKEEKVIDNLVSLTEDETVKKEITALMKESNQLKGMVGLFDFEEILQLNPIEVADTIEKSDSASDKAKELATALRKMVDIDHALAASDKPEELGGD